MRKILNVACLFSLMLCSEVYASIIYGIENAKSNKHHYKLPIYIQMGSFVSHNRAQSYKEFLQNKYQDQIRISKRNGQYKVIIGPFTSYRSLENFVNPSLKNNFGPISSALSIKNVPIRNPQNGKFFITGLIGGQKGSINSSATVDNGSGLDSPYNRDIYSGSNNTDMSTALGFYAGYRLAFERGLLRFLALGFQYQHFFLTKTSGDVAEFSLPDEFTNYSYNWQNATNLLLANAKLNFKGYKSLFPYFNVGIGAALNQTQGYSESAYLNVTPRISPNYKKNSDSNFAYILGAGIDYEFSSNVLFSLGYQYSYLGSSSLGYGVGSWSSQKLDFGSLTSNAFIFGLTYLFDKPSKLDV